MENAARRQGIWLRSFAEYQHVWEHRGYLAAQTQRLWPILSIPCGGMWTNDGRSWARARPTTTEQIMAWLDTDGRGSIHLVAQRGATARVAELGNAAAKVADLARLHMRPTEAAQAVRSSTVLVRVGEGAFGFIHQSVLEWLAARWVAHSGAERLASGPLSPLMVDFLCDLAGDNTVVGRASRVVRAVAEGESVTKANAALSSSGVVSSSASPTTAKSSSSTVQYRTPEGNLTKNARTLHTPISWRNHERLPATSTTPTENHRTTGKITQIERHHAISREPPENGQHA